MGGGLTAIFLTLFLPKLMEGRKKILLFCAISMEMIGVGIYAGINYFPNDTDDE